MSDLVNTPGAPLCGSSVSPTPRQVSAHAVEHHGEARGEVVLADASIVEGGFALAYGVGFGDRVEASTLVGDRRGGASTA